MKTAMDSWVLGEELGDYVNEQIDKHGAGGMTVESILLFLREDEAQEGTDPTRRRSPWHH
jgi:hypothetical protein